MPSHYVNMSNLETKIRIFSSLVIMGLSIYFGSYILGAIALYLLYSAATKFCIIYYLFDINKKYSIKNYYLSLLPKYRTSPAFIFSIDGKIVFANDAAKNCLPWITNIASLGLTNHLVLINEDKAMTLMYDYLEKNYQVEIKGLSQEKLLLSYFTDVTKTVTLNKEIEETQKEVIYAMGEIGETRSKETGNHVKRVALYSYELAKLYGLEEREASLLMMASPMHDIGKVGIPDAILNAPRKLTADEFKVMQTHAELGYNMLKHSHKPILQAAATVAHQHHEKYDGSGYPQGLNKENIHIFGRITAIADVFDALGSKRVYKEAWALEDILKLFEREKERHFDPKLIELFIDNLDTFATIQKKYKDNK